MVNCNIFILNQIESGKFECEVCYGIHESKGGLKNDQKKKHETNAITETTKSLTSEDYFTKVAGKFKIS